MSAEPSALGDRDVMGAPGIWMNGRMSRHMWSLVKSVMEPSPPPTSRRPDEDSTCGMNKDTPHLRFELEVEGVHTMKAADYMMR